MSDQKFCTFRVGGTQLGVPVGDVSEVLGPRPIATIPMAPPGLPGLVNLRGSVITAVDLPRLIGAEDVPPTQSGEREPSHVVVEVDGNTYSLMVDELDDYVEIPEDDRLAIPDVLEGLAGSAASAAYSWAGGILLILDVKALVRGADTSEVAQLRASPADVSPERDRP